MSIDDWCWKYPINKTFHEYCELNMSLKWQEKHCIKPDNIFNNEVINFVKTMVGYIDLHEKRLINYHTILPNLGHTDLNTYVAFETIKDRMGYGITDKQKVFFKSLWWVRGRIYRNT